MFRMTDEKCCFFIDLRIGCYIIASFSLAFYVALGSWVIFNTVTMPEKISLKDPNAMEKLRNVLVLGQFLFPVAVLLIKYTIILLIALSKKSRFLINMYLKFAKYAFTAFVAACIAFQYCYPMDPYVNAASVSIPLHASFLYTIRSYWKKLEPNNPKKVQHIV